MIIKNGLVLLPNEDNFTKVNIRLQNGVITEIGSNLDVEDQIIDASNLYILPGAIDPHVHFNDPGFTERENFYSGSCAAASGGITTVIDMPCTSIPPVTNKKNLQNKFNIIQENSIIDFGLFGGVSAQSLNHNFPDNFLDIADLVLGFKTYFISGMKSFDRLNNFQLKKVLQTAKKHNKIILLHAENFDYINEASSFYIKKGNSPIEYYKSRPEIAEIIAVSSASEIAKETGAELHIVHISSAKSVEFLTTNNITCETAPHYLEFDLNDFNRIGSPLKVTPPVKSLNNKMKLWEFLRNGNINFVASDHAPCPKELKQTGSIWSDYSGIPGVETLFPYMFSEGYLKKRISLKRLAQVCSENAAKRYGLFHSKGNIQIGKDGDFVLIDPKQYFLVKGDNFFSKGKITPFEGMKFNGKIVKTILRGKIIYDSEIGITAKKGFGNFLVNTK